MSVEPATDIGVRQGAGVEIFVAAAIDDGDASGLAQQGKGRTYRQCRLAAAAPGHQYVFTKGLHRGCLGYHQDTAAGAEDRARDDAETDRRIATHGRRTF